MAQVTLTAEHLVKRYGGVVALADGSLRVSGGEVLALMGANGSGKSTLSKIITGVVAPDGGTLRLDGREARFRSPQEARRAGIGAVYQELSLVPDLTVEDNIWLAHEPLSPAGLVSTRTVRERTAGLLELFAGAAGPGLTPDALVSELAPDERQIVEILKALSLEPNLVILDEATSSLDSLQVARLFELVADWKRRGRAIIFVSHRMEEVFRICDRAVVLRGGAAVGEARLAETSERELVQLMIGGEVPTRSRRGAQGAGAPLLAATGLSSRRLRGVTLELRPGELLGLGGLHGQGQSELLLALFGAVPFSGQVTLDGRPARFASPRQAIRAGVAFVPGDRGREGLLPSRSILENLQLPSWRRYGTPLRVGAAREDAAAVARDLRLVAASLEAPATSLSGGNAQKVVVGKWLLRRPRVLLLDDPTRGVDVGAKGELYAILDELRASGAGIVLYSSDDEELLGLCDRVLVLQDGQMRAELAGPTLTRADLVSASMGAVER
ncbi:MAG TPA: sugar ABC transporter ATP-binding protein [Chloroflexaceae bacterium]|nr:sugar ABC transporter ATP-binding protein [Chloroflexaceae bacterium]